MGGGGNQSNAVHGGGNVNADAGDDAAPTKEQPRLLWTIRNKRYDFAAFAKHHPGGAAALNLGRGRDCTELFESYHRVVGMARPRSMLSKYYVEDAPADAVDASEFFDWSATPFYDALTEKVRAYFKDNELSHKSPWPRLCWMGLNVLLFFYSVVYGLMRGQWWALLVAPVTHWLGPSLCMHDGAHYALSHYPAVNRALSYLGSVRSPASNSLF
jgi:hypothetical protein